MSWIYRILLLFYILNGQLSNLIWSINTVCIIPSNKKNYGFTKKERHWNSDSECYSHFEKYFMILLHDIGTAIWIFIFNFKKNPSLITSQKLNICIAAKMKHSPNITEIKTWNFLRNTRSRGFKRDFIISLEFWKFWNIIKYSFANFLEITNGKLCFLQREGEEIWRRSKFSEEHRHQ